MRRSRVAPPLGTTADDGAASLVGLAAPSGSVLGLISDLS